ncbi:MAG TPA: gamma-glutamylcyclotransferase family protein [Methanocella sp.]|uniref:gamma-glutamylcyclotransferase family protein n=1 Tax=Methanocella sp. TaxID=2052833 RepID=UPI002CB4EB4F|nr:gamma-glutamylcyclotransferase family protein [Methanocella sp.]HTY90059.1 gamma-glutamylcyclotransferase family protein [Methanocella sp.]
MAEDNVNMFVYGTLMDKSRLNSVIKRIPEMHAAKVSGYRQFYDDRLGFKSAEKDERSTMRGMLLLGITLMELRQLDFYEGVGEGSYRRVKVRATALDTKAQVEAFMYVKNE